MKGLHVWLRLSALLVGLSSGTALAGDQFKVERVAFSPDGARVMAFVSGVQDGSGFDVARLVVLDTVSGTSLRDVSKVSQESGVDVGQQLLKAEEARLRDWALLPGRLSKPRYQVSLPDYPMWNDGWRAGTSNEIAVKLWSKFVPIVLNVTATKDAGCNARLSGFDDAPAALFQLKVAQQSLPAPAGLASLCASRYRLERVDVQGNRALLTLRAYNVGFEGPNAVPVFVAAKLN